MYVFLSLYTVHLLCCHALLARVLQEEAEHRLNHRRNVHLQLITHGNHYLLDQQNNGVLNRTTGVPKLLPKIKGQLTSKEIKLKFEVGTEL